MIDSLGNKIPKNAFILRHTEVGEFLNCPRKWYFTSQHGLNLTSKTKDTKLRFGTCWHAGLEDYYNLAKKKINLDNNTALSTAKQGIVNSFTLEKERMQQVLGDLFHEELIQDTLEKEITLLNQLIHGFIPWALAEAQPTDKELLVKAVEPRILVRVAKSNCWLATRLDTVFEYRNQLWIGEHKTTSKSASVNNADHLPLDLQMDLQLWAFSKLVSSNNDTACTVAGALYTLARKQKPGPRVKSPLFGRHLVFRSQLEMTATETDLYWIYRRMRQYLIGKPKYVRGAYNPQPWGGHCTWGCAFNGVCQALKRGEDVKYLLDTNFIKRKREAFKDTFAIENF